MTALSSDVYVRFGPEGVAEVDASARLTSLSGIYCHVYGDAAPVLQVTYAHVRMAVSVPDPARVTAQDVALARELVGAVARYVAELERLAADCQDTPGPDACPECVA
jgi:hypothetical protein